MAGVLDELAETLSRLVTLYDPEEINNILLTNGNTVLPVSVLPALNVAVQTGNVEAVGLLLSAFSVDMKREIVNSQIAYMDDSMPLLLAAAIIGHEGMVKLLLDLGANPNAKVADDLTILCFLCLKKFREDPYRYSQIIRLLLDNGVDLSVSSTFSTDEVFSFGFFPLHLCAIVAKNSPTLARRIVDNSSPTCYDVPATIRFGTSFSQEAFGTPLSLALQRALIITEACEVFRHSRDDTFSEEFRSLHENFCKNLFHSLALPLFMYGALLAPDPFDARSDGGNRLCRTAFADPFLSSVFFPYLNNATGMLMNFIIAARQTSRLNVAELALQTSRIPRLFIDESRDLLEAVKQSFPLSLQACCRIAILANLPRGPERFKAINRLPLPDSLCAFLQYREFTAQQAYH